MNKREKTFMEKVKKLHGDNFVLLTPYLGAHNKLQWKCKKCGTVKETIASAILKIKKCRTCAILEEKEVQKNKEINELNKLFGEKIKIINALEDHKYEIHSNICGHSFIERFYKMKKFDVPACKKCRHEIKYHEEKLKIVKKQWEAIEKDYKLEEGCTSLHKKFKVTHLECGFTWECIPYTILAKKVEKCPQCSKRKKLDTEAIGIKIKKRGFTLLSECQTAQEFITIQHDKCGTIFTKQAKIFLKHYSCPNCYVTSRGEEIIRDFLNKNNIHYKKEIAFKDLRGLKGGYLRYDFGIYDGEDIKVLIEYDGQQHFKDIDNKYFRDSFKKRKLHDEMKTKYCKDKGIPLVRISFKEIDFIEEILEEMLICQYRDNHQI